MQFSLTKGFAETLTCQGQFPGLASTPPITRDTGDLPHDAGPGVGVTGPVVTKPSS